MRITARTRTIAGVETTVVRDVVRRPDGSLAEATDDWYAADQDGNVWYFGEDTATYDEGGHLEDRDGSWEAGVDGAVAGIIMPADPRPSQAAYMEFAKGEAEDQAWVVQRLPSVQTPGGRQEHIVRTLEWSRLEPDVVSMKFYARGLGIVEEKDIAAGDEHFWVVSSSAAAEVSRLQRGLVPVVGADPAWAPWSLRTRPCRSARSSRMITDFEVGQLLPARGRVERDQRVDLGVVRRRATARGVVLDDPERAAPCARAVAPTR